MKNFADKQKVRKFSATKAALEQMLKELPQAGSRASVSFSELPP